MPGPERKTFVLTTSGTYSEVDRPAVGLIGKRTPDHWSDSGVYDSRVVPVVGAVGSDLGAVGWLPSSRRGELPEAHSDTTLPASRRARRQRKGQSARPSRRTRGI